jgi:5-formyltetrahydrofolate cyclo-ligase
MNMGLDYSEILLILILVLVFFGSKEIPNFIRQAAKFIAKIRVYSDKVTREIKEIGRLDEPMPSYDQEVIAKKNAIRETYIAKRKDVPDNLRGEKTTAIWKNLAGDPAYSSAKAIMLYVETGAEVETRQAIRDLLASGRRVVLPYTNEDMTIGIGEITDLDRDVETGPLSVSVPVKEKRDNFFKSDIQIIVCPAVAFDIYGARLGRGKGCYDRFLREMKGRVPIYGLAFDCQMLPENERLPFAYHDVVMDQVVTESGFCIKKPDEPESAAGATAGPAQVGPAGPAGPAG